MVTVKWESPSRAEVRPESGSGGGGSGDQRSGNRCRWREGYGSRKSAAGGKNNTNSRNNQHVGAPFWGGTLSIGGRGCRSFGEFGGRGGGPGIADQKKNKYYET